MSVLSYSGLLIELDCLFDTRLATVHSFGKEYTANALENNYFWRETDVFPGITREQFNERYANRDKRILKDALPTPMIKMVRDFVKNTLALINNSPFHMKPLIIINVYPYKLSESEIKTVIRGMVNHTNKATDVSVVNLDNKGITPSYVKNDISVLVKYDYVSWLETHSENNAFLKTSSPESVLLGPLLYFVDPPEDAQEHLKKNDDSNFVLLEQCTAPIIGLKLLPISEFSVLLPKDIQSLKNSS